jgi:nitroreductase
VAKKAPSAGGLQDQRFQVITDKETLAKLEDAAPGQRFKFSDASAMIVVTSDREVLAGKYGERGKTVYCYQDTAASIQNILLAATALGLGACWVGGFDTDMATDQLGIPDSEVLSALVVIGYCKTS